MNKFKNLFYLLNIMNKIDLTNYIYNNDTSLSKDILHQCHKYGIIIVKDPRVSEKDNDSFLDMLEKYYQQDEDILMKDARPEFSYQAGITPSFVELPRDHCEKIYHLDQANKAHKPLGKDPKYRYMWKLGEVPPETNFSDVNSHHVIPENFPEWENNMNNWGNQMLATVKTVTELLAISLGLDKNHFKNQSRYGAHLLAPTGIDVSKYPIDTIIAGYHYDISFLTIHGKSRFSGLYIWTREGEKILVKVPPGYLLLQVGRELEYLTGGYCMAGFHEVIINQQAKDVLEQSKTSWRVSTTVFYHMDSDSILEPLDQFKNNEANKKYPKIIQGNYLKDELKHINLSK